MFEAYKQGWQSIVKPRSFPYYQCDLGPQFRQHHNDSKISIERLEFDFKNEHGEVLKASIFMEECKSTEGKMEALYQLRHGPKVDPYASAIGDVDPLLLVNNMNTGQDDKLLKPKVNRNSFFIDFEEEQQKLRANNSSFRVTNSISKLENDSFYDRELSPKFKSSNKNQGLDDSFDMFAKDKEEEDKTPYIPLKTALSTKEEPHKCLSTKPMLIYCHSHSANRLEGIPLVNSTTPDFNLCVFDFSGCGHSKGNYVTLGAKEAEEIRCLISTLRNYGGVKEFVLYGRSMGAVASLLFLDWYANTFTKFFHLSRSEQDELKESKLFVKKFDQKEGNPMNMLCKDALHDISKGKGTYQEKINQEDLPEILRDKDKQRPGLIDRIMPGKNSTNSMNPSRGGGKQFQKLKSGLLDIEIIAVVLDSPFTNAEEMLKDLLSSKSKVPRFLVSALLFPLGSTLCKETGYDVLATSPKDIVQSLNIPAYFMVSDKDTISPPEKLKQMFARYGSKLNSSSENLREEKVEKVFRQFEGEHNSMRSQNLFIDALQWVKKTYDNRFDKDFNENVGNSVNQSMVSLRRSLASQRSRMGVSESGLKVNSFKLDLEKLNEPEMTENFSKMQESHFKSGKNIDVPKAVKIQKLKQELKPKIGPKVKGISPLSSRKPAIAKNLGLSKLDIPSLSELEEKFKVQKTTSTQKDRRARLSRSNSNLEARINVTSRSGSNDSNKTQKKGGETKAKDKAGFFIFDLKNTPRKNSVKGSKVEQSYENHKDEDPMSEEYRVDFEENLDLPSRIGKIRNFETKLFKSRGFQSNT